MSLLKNCKTARIIVLLGLGLSSCGERIFADTSQSTVRFVVTGCWGTALTRVTISLSAVEHQTVVERLSYPSADTAQLPEGRYHVLIEATGFFPSSAMLDLAERNVEHRSCLTVAPVSGTTRPWVGFKGSVAPQAADSGPLWTRLVGLYTDTNLTATVGADGAFSFAKLQPGRYLLLLFDSKGLRSQKELDVRGDTAAVTFP